MDEQATPYMPRPTRSFTILAHRRTYRPRGYAEVFVGVRGQCTLTRHVAHLVRLTMFTLAPRARYLARRAAHAPPSAGSRSYMITCVLNAGEAAARRRAGPGSGRCWPAVAPSSTRDGAVQAHIASYGLHAPMLHWAFACPAVVSRCRTTISTAFRWVSRR